MRFGGKGDTARPLIGHNRTEILRLITSQRPDLDYRRPAQRALQEKRRFASLEHQVALEATVGSVDFGDAALPLLIKLGRRHTAKMVQHFTDQLDFVGVELALAHFAVDVAQQSLLGGEEQLHEVAAELLEGAPGGPRSQDLLAGQQARIGQPLVVGAAARLRVVRLARRQHLGVDGGFVVRAACGRRHESPISESLSTRSRCALATSNKHAQRYSLFYTHSLAHASFVRDTTRPWPSDEQERYGGCTHTWIMALNTQPLQTDALF